MHEDKSKQKVLVVIETRLWLIIYSLNFISEYTALSYNFDYTTLKQVFLGMEIVFKSMGKLFASYLPEWMCH